ncbi:TPA: hypothetical protein DF272_06400 [Candidatus Falkowbacteria bacterium]|nr:hypothetical protein [Candidatus Falkowbacteria bacterium]
MLNQNFWKKINDDQAEYDQSRRIIIGQSSKALHLAKQTIFALHRNNLDEARTKLEESEQFLKALEKDFAKNQKLRFEGSWCAAVEEYVEARLFFMYVNGDEVGEITGLHIEPQEYLGGFSDFTGELLRRAVLLSAEEKFDEVKKIAQEISDAIDILLAYNLSGLLRTKFDQAKNNLNKIEHVLYDISMRR